MESRFRVDLLPEVTEFLKGLDGKVQQKILSNIERASCLIDPELFKKLNDEIWEFRTMYNRQTYRLFAFWDKPDTLVLATHGMVKKTQKTPAKEIKRAERIRREYLDQKMKTEKDRFKAVSLEDVKDELIGKIGTPVRDVYERELQLDLLSHAIKEARKERQLTQEQLGELVGVQKAQISKIERNAKSARLDTLLKVFSALRARVTFQVELES